MVGTGELTRKALWSPGQGKTAYVVTGGQQGGGGAGKEREL